MNNGVRSPCTAVSSSASRVAARAAVARARSIAAWISLRAAATHARVGPASIEEYPQPRPFAMRWVPGPQGGHETQYIDPEDGDDAALAAEAAEWSAHDGREHANGPTATN
jgi:hypothetical protein